MYTLNCISITCTCLLLKEPTTHDPLMDSTPTPPNNQPAAENSQYRMEVRERKIVDLVKENTDKRDI